MQLRLANQRYRCRQCGRCCRSFRPALTRLEVEAIARLPWPGEPPTRDYYAVLQGQPHLKKTPDGSCVFLDAENRCMMHAVFGAQCKALSCRAYPFELLATFPGEVSVAARYDCPAVSDGQGERLSGQRQELLSLASDPQLHLGSGFSETELDGLSREAIETITAFMAKALQEGDSSPAALSALTAALKRLGPTFLNDIGTLREVLPSMHSKACRNVSAGLNAIGATWPERTAIRKELLYYLRRDESLPDLGWSTRAKLFKATARLFFGGGNAHDFAPEHPDFPIAEAALFDSAIWKDPPSSDVSRPFHAFLVTRLETLQFFGRAHYGDAFFAGLDALCGTWKPALALARLNAAAHGRTGELRPEDSCFARAAIDHSFGRNTQKP